MNDKSKRDLAKAKQVITAWETIAPNAVFGGMTLEQFKEAIQPSLDMEKAMQLLKAEMVGLRNRFQMSSRGSRVTALKIVRSVRGDVQYGEDSPLYSAMGYIRESNRKSGLTRKLRGAKAAAE